MRIMPTRLPDVPRDPKVYGDQRGYFMEDAAGARMGDAECFV